MENFGELHIEDKGGVDEAYHLLVVEREGENKARGVHYDCTLNKISEKEYEDKYGNIYEEASSATFTHTAGSVYKNCLDDVHEDNENNDDTVIQDDKAANVCVQTDEFLVSPYEHLFPFVLPQWMSCGAESKNVSNYSILSNCHGTTLIYFGKKIHPPYPYLIRNIY